MHLCAYLEHELGILCPQKHVYFSLSTSSISIYLSLYPTTLHASYFIHNVIHLFTLYITHSPLSHSLSSTCLIHHVHEITMASNSGKIYAVVG